MCIKNINHSFDVELIFLKDLVEKRRKMMSEYRDYREDKAEEFAEMKDLRLQLRRGNLYINGNMLVGHISYNKQFGFVMVAIGCFSSLFKGVFLNYPSSNQI